MKLLIFVLNDAAKLDDLLLELADRGLRGATVLNSMGMARSIYQADSSLLMNSLQALLEPGSPESRTIFTVVDEQQETIFHAAVEKVVGELSKPNTGILFTLPVDSVTGLRKQEN